jgi:hypothetical protein
MHRIQVFARQLFLGAICAVATSVSPPTVQPAGASKYNEAQFKHMVALCRSYANKRHLTGEASRALRTRCFRSKSFRDSLK